MEIPSTPSGPTLTPPPPPPRFFGALWSVIWRYPLLVLLVGAAVVATGGWLASRLELRTNVAELLPSRDPAVEELQRLARHIDGTAIVQIVVESPDRDANLLLAGKLAERVRALGPELVSEVAFDVRADQAFFRERRLLYAPLADLEALRDALRGEIRHRKNPLLVDLLDEDDVDTVIARMKKRGADLDRFPTGFFETDEGKMMAVVCRPPGGLFAERAGERLVGEIRRIVNELDVRTYHPGMQVGLTGDVMSQIEERQALENDLVWATGLCVTLVLLVVVVFFGRLRAVPLVCIPALCGVAIAFGMADLLFGYLNASTAFMGSIVVGNGINFPIIVLARYEEERRKGHDHRRGAEIALSATIRPTAIAALGAAIAYASLMATRFRGFSQFGAIGGIGMVASWLATLTILPALLALFDRRAERKRQASSGGLAELVSRLATRFPRACLAVFVVCSVAAVLPLPRYLADPFEYNFRNLRNRRSIESGAAALAPRVNRIFGETLTPAVVLADRREHTDEIRQIILERDRTLPGGTLIGRVVTLEDFLPGDVLTQQKKLAVLAELREIAAAPEMKLASAEERARLRALAGTERLRVVSETDLPRSVLRPFTELDGTLGRLVLVYHAQHVSVWDGHNLVRIARLIGELPLHDGTIVRSSGHAVIFAAMIRSIVHDAPIATVVSLLGVSLLVLSLTGSFVGAGLVIATLFAGVLWMLGAAAAGHVRTNFLNFIALPITFGIGVDYGINIFLRYRLEGRGRVGRAVRATGGAVALCSLTTIIGYGALLVADNQALRSFGQMAILGEIACLSAALVGLPAYLVLRERRIVRPEHITGSQQRM